MRLDTRQIRCLMVAAACGKLKHRTWLLDAMTVCSDYTHEIEYGDTMVKVGSDIQLEKLKYVGIERGDVVRVNRRFVGIILTDENDLLTLCILNESNKACYLSDDVMEPTRSDISFALTGPILGDWGVTSVGRFVWNVITLQYPFDWKVYAYQNQRFTPDFLVGIVRDKVLKKEVTVDQFTSFLDHVYFIGHITELSVPSMTVKSLETDPRVAEVKHKFIEEHKGQMDDPLIIQQLEKVLISMDKEYLKDDPSLVFFTGLGSKSFDVQRKKMFLTVGGIPSFGTDAGKMTFIPNALVEGWTKEAFPSIVNEVRKGSYDRGIETAKGGAETKLVMRAFQDATVSELDCGTKRTIAVDCSVYDGHKFIGRTIQVGSADVIVTEENLDKYVTGKVIRLYSPLTCATKDNFCYKCCGVKAQDLNAKRLGIQTVKLTSKFLMISMKNMHGTALKVKNYELENIIL